MAALRTSSRRADGGRHRWHLALTTLVMVVSTMVSYSPPQSQSLSVRLGKPWPLASAPWQPAQLLPTGARQCRVPRCRQRKPQASCLATWRRPGPWAARAAAVSCRSPTATLDHLLQRALAAAQPGVEGQVGTGKQHGDHEQPHPPPGSGLFSSRRSSSQTWPVVLSFAMTLRLAATINRRRCNATRPITVTAAMKVDQPSLKSHSWRCSFLEAQQGPSSCKGSRLVECPRLRCG